MRSLFPPFFDTIKHLNILIKIPDYFDPHERRLVFQAMVVGVVVWTVVFVLKEAVHVAFHQTIHWVEHASTPWLVFVPLLTGALMMAAIVRYGKSSKVHYRDKEGNIHELTDVEGDGLERAIALYYASEPSLAQTLQGQAGVDVRWQLPTYSLTIRKFIATLITLGSGGSGGLEASVTLIGESTAAGLLKPRQVVRTAQERVGLFDRFWHWWRSTDPDDLQTAQLGGISAAVATLLGSPFAAAFFATEVMYRRRPIIEKLVYSLIPALIAFFLTRLVTGGHTAMFEAENLLPPPISLEYYSVVMLVAGLVALVSIYFSQIRVSFDDYFHHHQPNVWVRHVSGATMTGLIALSAAYMTGHGLDLVLGPGEAPINAALHGELTTQVALIALIAKLLATIITIGSGGSAGLLVPSIFFGTMVAAAIAPMFGYEPYSLIIPAVTASLVSIVNVPMAAILFTVEAFGAPYMVPALLTLVVASILAHDNPIYRTQREEDDSRQIIPGYSVRRVPIPDSWVGQTIIKLQIRKQYSVNVIGIVEAADDQDRSTYQANLNPDLSEPLDEGDILIVLGADEMVETFELFLRRL